MSATPTLSIVVPSRSGIIDGLRAELAKQSFTDWEVVINTEPPTPAHARNAGAKQAKGRWLLFLDDDIQPSHPDVLGELVRALEELGPDAIVGVPNLLLPAANRFQRWLQREYFSTSYEGLPRLQPVSWADSVNGRCMAMSRQTFAELGGFDARMISGEEPELLYRHLQRGGRICMLTTRWVYYAPPESFSVAVRKTLWYAKGNVQLTRKHPAANHRTPLRGRVHAAMYLALRTVALLPLMFLKVSYHYRVPRLTFRPICTVCSYIGAWAYCIYWFRLSRLHDTV